MVKRIISLGISIAVVGVIVIAIIDYTNFNKGENAQFCLKEETKTYDDGKTYECTGLGYKIFKYDRTSMPNIKGEFGVIFLTKEKQPE